MVFSSTIFLFLFLPFALLGYYLIDRRFKNVFLLLTSIAFYAWGEPAFVFVMLFSVLMNYGFAILVCLKKEQFYQRSILTLMVAFNVSLFFYYKYLDFTIFNLNQLFGWTLPPKGIALPIGISFFTFQAMSYVFDVYRGKGQLQKNPLNVALYIMFFPQLIAGPIVRYETVAREIENRRETLDDFAKGIKRFIAGLAKKAILANSIAVIADRAFGYTNFSELSVLMAWLGAVAYTLQIFLDFSGYSDMAIGLGLMFGFHFEENFNYPYISKSVSEFWRRWHISLGTWFKDYVYIPLGGSRCSTSRQLFNLFVVWLLTGLWHGAAWHYVAWGMTHFVLLVFEKFTNLPRRLNHKISRIGYQFFTMTAIILGRVLSRSANLPYAWGYLKSMFGLMRNDMTDVLAMFLLLDNLVIFSFAFLASIPFHWKALDKIYGLREITYLLLYILSLSFIVNSSYNPFIYFNF